MFEQPGPYSGSVPHAYRLAIFWRWAAGMPRGIPAGFIALLYALGTAADPAGKLQFNDRRKITIKDLAAAIRTDEKDTRRFVNAALAAGVLTVEGERGRGKTPLYVLVVAPRPNWDAALAKLKESKRDRAARKPPPWQDEDAENGGPPPVLPEGENGGPPPVSDTGDATEERGTAPRTRTGDRPPNGSGDRPPFQPGHTFSSPWEPHEGSHGTAEVPEQPPVRAPAREKPNINQEPGVAKCRSCHSPIVNLPGQRRRELCRTCENPRR